MAHRDFSFEARDDRIPSYYMQPHHHHQQQQAEQQYPPPSQHLHQQQQHPYQQPYPPVHEEPQYLEEPSHFPQNDHENVDWRSYEQPQNRLAPGGTDIQHQNTVIRKEVPPESAAAAAATLAAVREDLIPPMPPQHHQQQHHHYQDQQPHARSAAGTPVYRTEASTPASQAPLLQGPVPPTHQWDQGPGGSPGRNRVLVDPLLGQYTDNPYKRMSTTWDPSVSQTAFDGTNDLLSDDDDDLDRPRKGAAAGGVMGTIGGMVGKRSSQPALAGAATAGDVGERGEKSEWLKSREKSSKKTRWTVVGVIILLLLIGGGVAAGIIVSKQNSSSGSDSDDTSSSDGPALSASEDVSRNGILDKNSPEIKKLMSNDKLHKVFHGMDYTPLNGVYPECIEAPPTQNNITRDIAVLSLLTDKIRLYGTDCNQTEMVMHAIDALEVDMKVWIGVWLDANSTTNERQLGHLYTLLENDDYHDKFDGVAVGNEVLFAETLTETQLFSIIDEVRSNLTTLGYNIPVGTSDLGSNWKTTMASQVDVLMANVHPFFAGIEVDKAADWTIEFFEENNVALTKGLSPKPRVMISEVGWPTGGGKTNSSIAGIDELQTFMDDFVCKQNKAKLEYFWFSGFDEPWKVRYNEPGKEWEDKWGLLDVNRKLKKGLKIPTCT